MEGNRPLRRTRLSRNDRLHVAHAERSREQPTALDFEIGAIGEPLSRDTRTLWQMQLRLNRASVQTHRQLADRSERLEEIVLELMQRVDELENYRHD